MKIDARKGRLVSKSEQRAQPLVAPLVAPALSRLATAAKSSCLPLHGPSQLRPCHRPTQITHRIPRLQQDGIVAGVHVARHEPALGDELDGGVQELVGALVLGGEAVDDAVMVGVDLEATDAPQGARSSSSPSSWSWPPAAGCPARRLELGACPAFAG